MSSFRKRLLLLSIATIGVVGIWLVLQLSGTHQPLAQENTTFSDYSPSSSDISLKDSHPLACDFYLNHMVDTELSNGQTVIATFTDISDKAIAHILTFGVFVVVREPDYAVLAGSKENMRIVKELGHSYRYPMESDYVPRHVRVKTLDAQSRNIIIQLMLDPSIPPGPCYRDSHYCTGIFFDLAIECLNGLGYEITPK